MWEEEWRVNHKAVEMIWWRTGVKVPARQPKWRGLWHNDGKCAGARPAYRGHVWSYDAEAERTKDLLPLKMLTTIDE